MAMIQHNTKIYDNFSFCDRLYIFLIINSYKVDDLNTIKAKILFRFKS